MGSAPRSDAFNTEDVCGRYSRIYIGAITDVLDEMGFRNQCLPSSIRGLTMDAKVVGFAMTVEGQATSSVDPEEVYIPVLKMLGDLQPGDVIVSQPNDSISAHLGELSSEAAQFRGACGAVIDGGGSRHRPHPEAWIPCFLPLLYAARNYGSVETCCLWSAG